jgi:4'-phosphopantetheinyl transferase
MLRSTATTSTGRDKNQEAFFKTMRQSFATLEWSVIRSRATPVEQLRQFFLFWTLKESFIKNIGIGLGLDLQRMEFYYLDAAKTEPYDEVSSY